MALAALVAAAFLVPVGTIHATCSIGATDYAGSALRNASRTQLLLVGTVTEEHSSRRGTRTFYESVVEPQVMLKGDAPGGRMVLTYLGHLGADCSGGPRLLEGERVLLPVYWGRMSYGDGESGWQLTGVFAKVLLEDGEATLQWYLGGLPLGDAEAVIREYASAAGASNEQIEAAIAAAFVDDTNSGSDNYTWFVLAALASAAVIIAAAVLRSKALRGDA